MPILAPAAGVTVLPFAPSVASTAASFVAAGCASAAAFAAASAAASVASAFGVVCAAGCVVAFDVYIAIVSLTATVVSAPAPTFSVVVTAEIKGVVASLISGQANL